MDEVLQKAVKTLKEGGIILYPTDTVWGLGCDATDPAAVAKIFDIKQRSDSKSLVLLADGLDMIGRYVRQIPEIALQLVEVNDKPMTIIYPDAYASKAPEAGKTVEADRYHLAYNTVAADGSVGIRIPMMDFCIEMVKMFGRPVVSTSANISGRPTPASFSDISEEIRNAVDYIVDPSLEKYSSGKASSIIKVGMDSEITIIRD